MLSHLVGAANRADIRRLCQLELDKADMAARLDRQQLAMRDAVVTRDAQIEELLKALAREIAAEPLAAAGCATEENAVLLQLVAELERRLSREAERRAAADERLAATRAALAEARAARVKAERECEAGCCDMAAIEGALLAAGDETPETGPHARLGDRLCAA